MCRLRVWIAVVVVWRISHFPIARGYLLLRCFFFASWLAVGHKLLRGLSLYFCCTVRRIPNAQPFIFNYLIYKKSDVVYPVAIYRFLATWEGRPHTSPYFPARRSSLRRVFPHQRQKRDPIHEYGKQTSEQKKYAPCVICSRRVFPAPIL